MMKNNQILEEFLSEYTRLEGLLKRTEALPTTVLDYENSLTDIETREKLKVCRILRNYCRHHEDYAQFITVSDELLRFMKSMNSELEKPFLHVSDKTKRVTPIMGKDSLKATVLQFAKQKVSFLPLVVRTERSGDCVIGIISREMLINMIAQSETLASKIEKSITPKIIKMQPQYTIADPDDLLETVSDTERVVVVKDGKYKGIVIW